MYQHFRSGVPLMARGIVVANKDPDQLGRVKVTYPWLGTANSEVPSNWASVCQLIASKDSGSYFIPEKGDEVIVFFEGGNLDSPVIMGTLYNKQAKPVPSGKKGDFNSSGKNSLRYIKTKSGHLLCFDESEEENGIVLQDKDKRRFEIQTKKKKIIIADENENKIEIDGANIRIQTKSAAIELKSDKISVKAEAVAVGGTELELASGPNKVTLSSGGVTIDAAMSINLGGGAKDALLKGTTFLTLFNAHVHSTGVGPSGPPLIPLNPSVLSMKVNTE